MSMKFHVRTQLAFQRLQRRYKIGKDRGLYQVSALIRKEARESMRKRRGASKKHHPPTAHVRNGLKEINFHVQGSSSIIGPRKFRNSNFFNRPVPNIHEKGGTAVASSFRQRYLARYPERSFMWRAVTKLKRKGKISNRFRVTLQGSW